MRVAGLVLAALGYNATMVLAIIAAFGVNKRGAFASMLMITTVQTASIWNVGIKTAAAQNMVAIGFIEKAFGKKHPKVAACLENYACLLHALDRHAEARHRRVGNRLCR